MWFNFTILKLGSVGRLCGCNCEDTVRQRTPLFTTYTTNSPAVRCLSAARKEVGDQQQQAFERHVITRIERKERPGWARPAVKIIGRGSIFFRHTFPRPHSCCVTSPDVGVIRRADEEGAKLPPPQT